MKQSTEEIQQAVEEVFSDPVFQEGLEKTHSGFQSLFMSVYQGLVALVLRFIDWIRESIEESPVQFWLFFGVLLLILFLLLAHIGWTLSLAFRGGKAQGGRGLAGTISERVRGFNDLREEARAMAGKGSIRDGTRLLLLALLALLEENHILKVALGWTNREILERLRLRPEEAGALWSFERQIEDVSYGGATVSKEDFLKLDAVLDEISVHVKSGGLGTPARGSGKLGLDTP